MCNSHRPTYFKLFALNATKLAVPTLVRLCALMNFQMSPESASIVACIGTLFALEFLRQICVVQHMRSTGNNRRENIVTHQALKFFEHFMHRFHMISQILFVVKQFITMFAFTDHPYLIVHGSMVFQLFGIFERFVARFTFVVSLFRVDLHVRVQQSGQYWRLEVTCIATVQFHVD